MKCGLLASLNLALFVTGSPATIAAPPLTKVEPQGSILSSPRCDTILSAAESAVKRLGSTGGNAPLGFAVDLESLLSAASNPKTARAAMAGFQAVRDARAEVSALRFLFDFYDELHKDQKLAFCILPQDSSAGGERASHCTFVGPGHEGIVFTPVPDGGQTPSRWALNFLQTFAMVAGDRFLLKWMTAARSLETARMGSSDEYFRTFATDWDGPMPTPENLDQGFALVVLQMYQAFMNRAVITHFFPNMAPQIDAHLAGPDVRVLTTRRNSELTAPIMRRLGVNDDNYMLKVSEILTTLSDTIRRQGEMN